MTNKLEKLFKDSYLVSSLPDSIHIPPIGENRMDVSKPIEQATLDDIAFAAQALEQKSDALTSTLYALRRLYKDARAKGALGKDNIVEALSRKNGGAQ